MVLVKNWPFFHLFFKDKIGQENVFYDILERKNAFLGYKNTKLKKSKNWDFSKGVSAWFWSKIDQYFLLLIKDKIGQENVFYDILERKNAFLRFRNNKLKKTKNWDFSKGVNPWFWSNIGRFSIFFLGNIGQENVFYDIIEQKNVFLSYKNKKFKKSKNCFFFKGLVHGFGQKLAIFSSFV